MTVTDLYKALEDKQQVDLYSVKNGVFLFCGVCEDITSSCMELNVKHIYSHHDVLVVSVD